MLNFIVVGAVDESDKIYWLSVIVKNKSQPFSILALIDFIFFVPAHTHVRSVFVCLLVFETCLFKCSGHFEQSKHLMFPNSQKIQKSNTWDFLVRPRDPNGPDAQEPQWTHAPMPLNGQGPKENLLGNFTSSLTAEGAGIFHWLDL